MASWMVKRIIAARDTLVRTQMQSADSISIGQIYLLLIGNQPRVPWKGLMIGNKARPKTIFTMWMQLQNRLPTADRLTKWGIVVWKKLLCWLTFPDFTANSWDQHLSWAIRYSKGKSQQVKVFKLVYAECTYAFWIERNQRSFEGKCRQWDHIAKDIAYMCMMRSPVEVRDKLHQLIF
ncbi:hypothetical protein P3S68_021731 [Capsicum galapagoense]